MGLLTVFFGILLGLITGLLAYNRGRSFFAWMIFGFLCFIVALPVLFILPKDESMIRYQNGLKLCPYCFENIDTKATICKYCGKNLL